jgi:hypothetical protein
MYIDNSLEWWKLRIYQEVTVFLENPDAKNQAKLARALESYQAFIAAHKSNTNHTSNKHEQLISA